MVVLLNWALLVEWYMAGLVIKNVQKEEDMCYNEIGLCAQLQDTIPG